MQTDFEQIYRRLFSRSKACNFSGFDPFDGLNSRIFNATPLRKFSLTRLIWLQLNKRSPLNFRRFFQIQEGQNPKSLALFALAELSVYRSTTDPKHEQEAKSLLNQLDGMRLNQDESGHSGTAWGYNFDWQSRAFFAPKGTPTVVPTAFSANAFLDAYEAFSDESFLKTAEDVCVFITASLNRPVENETELCFSYTPLDNSVIFNASLLAGEVLSRVGVITENEEYLNLAARTVRFVVNRQKEDGSWSYGSKLRHAWVDNFHTAYIINSVSRINGIPQLREDAIQESLDRGVEFWLDNFFLADGTPKYFDRQKYPVDIHSAAAAIAVLCEMADESPRCRQLAELVAEWVVEHLLNKDGGFGYQNTRFYTNRIEYMRWGNAWMAFAVARLLEMQGRRDLKEPDNVQE